MIEDKYQELMNGEIDGVNSPEKSLELEKYLDANPEASRHYGELCDIGRVFSQAGEIDPPAGLRRAILSSTVKAHRNEETAGDFGSMAWAFRSIFTRRFAFTFSAGLVVGVCLFAALSAIAPSDSPRDVHGLYGTLAAGDRNGRLLAAGPIAFDLPGGSGEARFQYSDQAILAELNLSTEETIQVVFHYDENVWFEGFRALSRSDHTMRVAGNQTELTHVGVCDYSIVLRDDQESHRPIHMRVLAAGELLFESTVLPERK